MLHPHGIRGEVQVQAFNPEAPNLRKGTRVLAGERDFEITEIRPNRDGFIVRLAGIQDRDSAALLRGALLEVPEDTVAPEEGAYFVHQLIGLDVVLTDGTPVGRVVDVLQPGANDVYVVETPGGEVLIPAIGEVVRLIDVKARRLVITPLPGLLDESP